LIRYGNQTDSDVVVCILDEIDQCIPSARQLVKNVSDQTLFKFSEKYFVIASKDLNEMLEFARAFFKTAIIVPTGIDVLDAGVVVIEPTDHFQLINLRDLVGDIVLHKADKIELAQNIFYLDGRSEDSFEQGLEWQNKKFSLGHGSFFYPVNNEQVQTLDLPIIHQLVTPAAGLNWVNYLNKYGYDETTVVRFYDYSYLALDCMREVVLKYNGGDYEEFIRRLGRSKFKFIDKEWDYGFASMYSVVEPDNWIKIVNTVRFEFVHINLLEKLDITELVKPVPNTFINFSNIFSYYLTSCFYSLQSRIHAEQRILTELKDYNCHVGFISRAAATYYQNSKFVGHINEFNVNTQLKLPTWHEDN
jgi:hypothetical protein